MLLLLLLDCHDVDQAQSGELVNISLELCERRGGHPGLPVPNSPYGLCGRKAALNERTASHVGRDTIGQRTKAFQWFINFHWFIILALCRPASDRSLPVIRDSSHAFGQSRSNSPVVLQWRKKNMYQFAQQSTIEPQDMLG